MINNNASGIFQNNAVGVNGENTEDPSNAYDEQQQRVMGEDGLLRALHPINFQEKIMGGNNFAMRMSGKLSPMDNSFEYAQRVNVLTDKRSNIMQDDNNNNIENKLHMLMGSGNASDKINEMLGNNSQSNKKDINVDSILGFGNKSSDIVAKMLGGNSSFKNNASVEHFLGTIGSNKNNKNNINNKNNKNNSSNNKIEQMLGIKNNSNNNTAKNSLSSNKTKQSEMLAKMLGDTSKSNNILDRMFSNKNNKTNNKQNNHTNNIGSRVFAGFNIQDKITQGFGMGSLNTNLNTQKNSAINKINSAFNINRPTVNTDSLFGMFGNPERVAKKRMKQQHGLPMFGDFDGDRVLNMFDCDPLDPTKQGEQHDINSYLPTENENIGLENIVSDYNNEDDTDTNVIKPSTSDTMSVNRTGFVMGNSIADIAGLEHGYNGGDVNNDGVIDENDSRMLNSAVIDLNKHIGMVKKDIIDKNGNMMQNKKILDSLTQQRTNLLSMKINDGSNTVLDDMSINTSDANTTLDLQIDKITSDLQNGVGNTVQNKKLLEELYKQKRASSEQAFKELKYKDEKKEKDAIKKKQFETAVLQNTFAKEKFNAELDFAKNKHNDSVLLNESNKERQFALDEKKHNLDVAKLNLQAGKNDLALWETKLRAGQNMLGSLIGGGKPSDLGKKIDSGNSKLDPALLTGSQGANSSAMMQLVGGVGQAQSFDNKVYQTVGGYGQNKSFAEKVEDSVSRKSPEDLIAQRNREQEEQMMQQSQPRQSQQFQQMQQMQQIQQSQPQQAYQQSPQYSQQQTYQQQQPQQQYNIDWNEMTPQQAAQFDPQYAEYLAESEPKTGYRRGPYKKRR